MMQVTGISNAALLRALAEDVPDMHPTVRNQLLRIAKSIEAPAQVNRAVVDALKQLTAAAEIEGDKFAPDNRWHKLSDMGTAAIAAAEAQHVGINGLTEAETSATMSVMGLSKQAQPLELSDAEIEALGYEHLTYQIEGFAVSGVFKFARAILAAANKKADYKHGAWSAQREMSDEEIRVWWASENGLEDANMARLKDFTQVVRAVLEKASTT